MKKRVERQKRKNKIVIRRLEKGNENMRSVVSNFLDREFDATDKIKEVDILDKEGNEIAVMEFRD